LVLSVLMKAELMALEVVAGMTGSRSPALISHAPISLSSMEGGRPFGRRLAGSHNAGVILCEASTAQPW
jgi:hypothetical protein